MDPIVLICSARNEEDIIEAFVRHHAPMVSRMIIVNHRSDDATGKILQELQREGLPLEIQDRNSILHEHGDVMTALMYAVAEQERNAWMLPLDADEFIVTRSGTLSESLSSLSDSEGCTVAWKTYIPSTTSTDLHPLKRMTWRNDRELQVWYKVFVHTGKIVDPLARKISFGNHELHDEKNHPVNLPNQDDITLAHFPVRSKEQFLKKVIIGYLSSCAVPGTPESRSSHWRALYRFMEEKGDVEDEDLEIIARTYASMNLWGEKFDPAIVRNAIERTSDLVHDPLDWQELRYTSTRTSFLRSALKTMEEFARLYRGVKEHRSTE